MEFINRTPFPSLTFQSEDRHRQPSHVAVMRVTLEMRADGALEPAGEQEPIVLVDEYFGEPDKSSVRRENDLAPFKPMCDVIVNASAHAPGGGPSSAFIAGVRISGPPGRNGKAGPLILENRLVVTGPRFREKSLLGGWSDEPSTARIASLPLRYEYAYGGECRLNIDDPAAAHVDSRYLLTPEQRWNHPDGPANAPAAHAVCETNPVGIGFVTPWYLDAKGPTRIPAPQIDCIEGPVPEIGEVCLPKGFGVITRSWRPRLQLAGTFDDNWLRDGWPGLPDDFDFAYWNSAHPDMRIPYPKGDEVIELTNLMPPGAATGIRDSHGNPVARFVLPGLAPHLMARLEEGREKRFDFAIDTLMIDTDKRSLALVYRAVLPQAPGIRVLEARIAGDAGAKPREPAMKEGDEWGDRSESGAENG